MADRRFFIRCLCVTLTRPDSLIISPLLAVPFGEEAVQEVLRIREPAAIMEATLNDTGAGVEGRDSWSKDRLLGRALSCRWRHWRKRSSAGNARGALCSVPSVKSLSVPPICHGDRIAWCERCC